MKDNLEKPTAEAKALSLFLMAFKKTNPNHKEKSKRIKKLRGHLNEGRLSLHNYNKEVDEMLGSFGGYAVVVEKTVKFYIEKSGKWTLEGEDQYCLDARAVADKILNK